MPDIRLDRTNRHRCPPLLADDIADRPDFGRIANACTRAVALDEGDPVHIDIAVFVDRPKQCRLGVARRQRNAVRTAGRIDAGGMQTGVASVPLPQCPVGAAQNDRDATFRPDIAMAIGVIGTTEAFRRKHARLRKTDEGKRMSEKIDAADDRSIDFLAVQRPHSLIKRDQGRRTSRVDRHAGTAQTEDMRYPVGHDRQRVSRHEVRAAGSRILCCQIPVVEARCADIDTHALSHQGRRRKIGVLKRAPDQIEQNTLLRIHLRGFALRQPEDRRIEMIDIVKHTGRERVCLAGKALRRMPKATKLPTSGRNLADGASCIFENLP